MPPTKQGSQERRGPGCLPEAAVRRGIPEAEIIREGIHLAAMSSHVWDEPLDWPTFEGTGQPARGDEVTRAVARGAAES